MKPGDTVIIVDTHGQEHRGRLADVTAESVSVAERKGTVAVTRADVRRVKVRSGSRRARNIVIGAAVGLAAGAVADQTLGTYFRNESGESSGARVASYAIPIAVFGGIGAALPGYRTVYRVK